MLWSIRVRLCTSLRQPHSTTCRGSVPGLFVEIPTCFSSCCNVSSVGQADLLRKWSSFHRRKSCHWLLETSFMLTSQELTKLPAFLFHPGHCSLCRSMLIGLQIWSRWALSISIKQSNTRKETSLVYMWAGRKQTYHGGLILTVCPSYAWVFYTVSHNWKEKWQLIEFTELITWNWWWVGWLL